MKNKTDRKIPTASQNAEGSERARPLLHQHAHEIQPYGKIAKLPIALDQQVCATSVELLNQILADTMTLRDLYKKHHWQVAGHTFYSLHLLFDKHFDEQSELVDAIAERIQLLGGISIAMAPDIAETTFIPRPPRGREEAPVQISRMLEAHEIILKEARTVAKQAAQAARSSAPTNCRCGSSPSIWWTFRWCAPTTPKRSRPAPDHRSQLVPGPCSKEARKCQNVRT